MMELILSFAENDERIRLVGMEGSRVNTKVPKDSFQDYDITYVVSDMESYKRDDGWLDFFGKRIIMQKPEAMSLFSPTLGNWFSYLMLFEDGTRIDLKIVPLEELDLYLNHDKLLAILLDKDDRVNKKIEPTDIDYHVKKPTHIFFDDCCNEFWWVSTYVAKGLCRKEILYAAEHLNLYVRPSLLRMLSWKVGFETSFSLSVGKSYKYLENYVSPKTWNRLLITYRNDSYHDLWNALLEGQALFRETAQTVAEHFHFPYPDYDEKVTAYIKTLHHCRLSQA